MNATSPVVRELVAPPMLGLETRSDFRRQAMELLDQLPEGEGRLVVDLSATRAVDSSGLGALMLIQRRAAERRQTVVLVDPTDELRFLLSLTKLDDLFLFDSAPARAAEGGNGSRRRGMDGARRRG